MSLQESCVGYIHLDCSFVCTVHTAVHAVTIYAIYACITSVNMCPFNGVGLYVTRPILKVLRFGGQEVLQKRGGHKLTGRQTHRQTKRQKDKQT